jgi:hypothetical protein
MELIRIVAALLDDGDLVFAGEPAIQIHQLAAIGAEGEMCGKLFVFAGLGDGLFADGAEHKHRTVCARLILLL